MKLAFVPDDLVVLFGKISSRRPRHVPIYVLEKLVFELKMNFY